MKTFEIITRRSRFKRQAQLVAITLILLLSIGALTYRLLTHRTYSHGRKVEQEYYLLMNIAYPNIMGSGGIYRPTTAFSGVYHAKRWKDLDGVRVYYPDYDVSYDLSGLPIHLSGDYNPNYYSPLPSNKEFTFYNTNLKPEFDYLKELEKEKNDLAYVRDLPDHLVEVAVTFDKAYTYADIQKMIPDNLKINWYWIGTGADGSLTGLPMHVMIGTNDFGLDINAFLPSLQETLATYISLASGTTTYEGNEVGLFNIYEDIANYLKDHEGLDSRKSEDKDKMLFKGVVLTGKAENFAQLEKKDFIYATSLGISLKNQPYYQLEKE